MLNINPFSMLPQNFRSIQYLTSKRRDVTHYKIEVKNPLTDQREYLRGLFGKYLAIFNISRTGRVAFM
jgi:hypothetical protein